MRAYRFLLGLLPPDLRGRFGSEMQEVFQRRLTEARGSTLATWAVWLRAIADVFSQALGARVSKRGGGEWRAEALVQDLRYGLRSVVGTPAFSLVALVTLALGIGASTATFSVVHALLLRKLPFEDPARIVVVWPEVNANKAMALMAAERMPSLEDVAGMGAWTLTLSGVGEPRELTGLQVSPGYFDILGVRPLHGRAFAPNEDLPGEAGVVLLSHDFWVDAFGADEGVVGRVIDLGGANYDARTVIGVMPPGVDELWDDVDVWIPLEGDRTLGLGADETWYVNERIARLAPGATLEQANAEVRDYAAEVQRTIPDHFSVEEAMEATVRPMREYLTRDVSTAVLVALGAVSLVLVIGCFNVANLLLARGDARARDLAVRSALGAGRLRTTRMLLGEAACLGLLGGATGVAAAHALVEVVVWLAPETFPGIEAVSVNRSVLLFAVAVTALATVIAGLVPAVRVGRATERGALTHGSRGAAAQTGSRLTPFLVGAQVALAVVVTVGSGLMLRSLGTLLAVDPGIDGEGVLAFKPTPAGRYPDAIAFRVYYEEVIDRVAALGNVTSVGAIQLLPGTTGNWSFPTFPEGYLVEEGEPTPTVNFRAVRGEYFETARISLSAGRFIEDDDREDTTPVVVVNEAFVSRFWPRESPLGRTLSIFSASATRHEVVGVVADVHQHGPDKQPVPEMYFSHGQMRNQMSLWILARVRTGDPLAMTRAIHDAVWSIDPDVPIAGTAHLAVVLRESTHDTRFFAVLLSSFGGLALALSALGVFSVTTYTSGRRRPEFGVRIALGSSRSQVIGASLRSSLAPVVVGLAFGLTGAAVGSRLLGSVLFGIEPTDPATFAGVTLLLGASGLVASVIPAWRTSRVDPITVLGSE